MTLSWSSCISWTAKQNVTVTKSQIRNCGPRWNLRTCTATKKLILIKEILSQKQIMFALYFLPMLNYWPGSWWWWRSQSIYVGSSWKPHIYISTTAVQIWCSQWSRNIYTFSWILRRNSRLVVQQIQHLPHWSLAPRQHLPFLSSVFHCRLRAWNHRCQRMCSSGLFLKPGFECGLRVLITLRQKINACECTDVWQSIILYHRAIMY